MSFVAWNIIDKAIDTAVGQVDSEAVAHAAAQLRTLGSSWRDQAVAALREAKRGKVANGMAGAFRADRRNIAGQYFSCRAFSYKLGSHGDSLDGVRAALVLHLNLELMEELIARFAGVPTADVMNADSTSNPDGFRAIFRYTELRQIAQALRSVSHEAESFRITALSLLAPGSGSGSTSRSNKWPFDHDVMEDTVLLGFSRSPSPSLLNSGVLSSPVSACGLVRSRLEAVLFSADFRSSMAGIPTVTATGWAEALDYHADDGAVDEAMRFQITEMYGALSEALHSGFLLTRGEVYFFGQIIDALQDALVSHRKKHAGETLMDIAIRMTERKRN